MRFRLATVTFLSCALAAASSAGVEHLQRCDQEESSGVRATCLDRALGDLVDSGELEYLRSLVPSAPDVALQVATARLGLAAESRAAADGPRAGWLDLIGSAQFELGRFEASADALLRAIRLDDGTCRLHWLSPKGEQVRSAAFDSGDRLERAARSLLAAGRKEEAAATLGQALALGAGSRAAQAWEELEGSPPPGRDATRGKLTAERWFTPVPSVEIELTGGESVLLPDDFRGEVLILSFWATWCEPCKRELPRLQAFHEAQQERGLNVLAVNVGEPLEIALPWAEDLGLTLPIGTAGREEQQAFRVSRLPLVVVVDRRGRIRGRWAGFQEQYTEEIAKLARRLVEETRPPVVEVAETMLGGRRFAVSWMRDAPASVDGAVVLPEAAGVAGVLVAAGRSLVHYRRDGSRVRSWELPSAPGILRPSPIAEDGSFALLGYRPGSHSVVMIDMPRGETTRWTSPSPLFDAEIRSSAPDEGSGAHRVAMATLSGLLTVSLPGGDSETLEGVAGAIAVRENRSDDAVSLVALEIDSGLCWLDGEGRVTRRTEAPPDAWSLLQVDSSGAIAITPSCVRSAAVGRFLPGDSVQIALATSSGQLVILDLASGETVFRAHWPEIGHLAAGTVLDGKTDDLVVVRGTEIAVLTTKESE